MFILMKQNKLKKTSFTKKLLIDVKEPSTPTLWEQIYIINQ